MRKLLVLVACAAAVAAGCGRQPEQGGPKTTLAAADLKAAAAGDAYTAIVLVPVNGTCELSKSDIVTAKRGAGHRHVTWLVVNLCGEVEVTVGNFRRAACDLQATGTAPFTDAQMTKTVPTLGANRRPESLRFRLNESGGSFTASGCWNFDVQVKVPGGTPQTIDPMIRIDPT